MSDRTCGECSLCCKVMGVREFNKPRYQWCDKFKPKCGCTIYADRPPSCQEFLCLWMADPSRILPEEFRPDKTHCVLTALNKDGTGIAVNVDPAYPTAHREGIMGKVLMKLAKRGMNIGAIVGRDKAFSLHPVYGWLPCVRIDKGDDIDGEISLFKVDPR